MMGKLPQGREEFTPTPEETRSLIRSYYTVRRNLLLRFKDDTIDESNAFATMLQVRDRAAGDSNQMSHAVTCLYQPWCSRISPVVCSGAVATGGWERTHTHAWEGLRGALLCLNVTLGTNPDQLKNQVFRWLRTCPPSLLSSPCDCSVCTAHTLIIKSLIKSIIKSLIQ